MIRIDTKADATELAKLLLDPTLTTSEAMKHYRDSRRSVRVAPVPPYRDDSAQNHEGFWEYGSEDR